MPNTEQSDFDEDFEHDANAAGVVLVFDDLGFEAGELLGLDRVAVGPGTNLYRRVYAEHPYAVQTPAPIAMSMVARPACASTGS